MIIEQSWCRIVLFHLTDSSKNMKVESWWGIFPSGRRTGFCRTWRVGRTSAQEPSQPASPGEVTHLHILRLFSVSLNVNVAPSKCPVKCYEVVMAVPTLGRMPRGCGQPPGSPQEAGTESAESLCTQAPASRSFSITVHFQCVLSQMFNI